ncbi:MAG: TonB-dependent receptor, partial [Saprospiraceae bacterium]|nr:TonB-dependent receptor [Saprospiraceae bacterium]
INDRFSIYGNYSWKSRVNWGPGGTGEFDAELPFTFTLVVPKHKYRLGVTYAPESGWFGSLSFQHDDEFFGQVGQFQGLTGGTNIFDGALGYKFNDKYQLTVAANNLFNTPYRAFANFPVVKRRTMVKFLYNLTPEEKSEKM